MVTQSHVKETNNIMLVQGVEKMIMEKMNQIYQSMADISSMANAVGIQAPTLPGVGGGPVRGSGYGGGARDSAGPYARTADTTKKHYGW